MVLTAEQMRTVEENAVLSGMSWLRLMENAGAAATKVIRDTFELENKKIVIVCGKGNNGGDGFVIADCLYGSGADVSVILPFGEPVTEDAAYYRKKLKFVKVTDTFDPNDDYDVIVDALFGIGFNRAPSDEVTRLFDEINSHSWIFIADTSHFFMKLMCRFVVICLKSQVEFTFT